MQIGRIRQNIVNVRYLDSPISIQDIFDATKVSTPSKKYFEFLDHFLLKKQDILRVTLVRTQN